MKFATAARWFVIRLLVGILVAAIVGVAGLGLLDAIDFVRGTGSTGGDSGFAATTEWIFAVVLLGSLFGGVMGGLPAAIVVMALLYRFEPLKVVLPLAGGALVGFMLYVVVAPAAGWVATQPPVLSLNCVASASAGGVVAALVLLVIRRVHGESRGDTI